MTKKFLALTLVLVLAAGFAAISAPLHVDLDTALVTGIALDGASISTTFRIGAKGESYTLGLAATYNPESEMAFKGVKGIGPTFSLKGWGIRFQLDGYVWPNKYARATLKYKVSEMVNVGVMAQSDLHYNYDFGTVIGIEY